MQNLHPACIECRKVNVAKKDIIDKATKRVVRRKGEFAINCSGILLDPEEALVQITPRKIIEIMGEDEIRSMARLKDPMLWATDNLMITDPDTQKKMPWTTQEATDENIELYNLDPMSKWYQEIMTRCTATRQVFRIGRRSGKTWTIVARILHKMFTEPNFSVIAIAPNLAQVDILFEAAEDFIHTSPTLKHTNFRSKKSPPRELELPNGSQMRGFIAGSDMVRGQSAKLIVIDEADHVKASDFSAVMAILSEFTDSILLAASTPSGAHSKFYDWNHDPQFRAFHFPSMCRPKWTQDMEFEQRKENPGAKYDREVLANFTEIAEGVFQLDDIDEALERCGNYVYGDHKRQDDWIYTFGVDWNPVNGTEVYVTGIDPDDGFMRPVEKSIVFREGATQIDSMSEIIRLNRKWIPSKINADIGAGATQVQLLKEFGKRSPRGSVDSNLEHIIEAIDFGSKIEINDPSTNLMTKTYAKPAIVEAAIRFFEAGVIGLSKSDPELEKQLRGFIVKKINGNRPVYGMVTEDLQDHALDAFVLSLFAFTMELTPFGHPEVVGRVGFINDFGGKAPQKAKSRSFVTSNLKSPVEGHMTNEHNSVHSSSFVREWWNQTKEKADSGNRPSRAPISRKGIKNRHD
jgi:hypothetical protein